MKSIFSQYLKKVKNKITLSVGEVILTKKIGEGGNGVVYSSVIYEKNYAIKFLLSDSKGQSYKRKTERFLAEYFNVMSLPDNKGIVKYIDYDVLTFENETSKVNIPVIIMKQYNHSLKILDEIDTIKKFEDIFNFLLNTVEKIHKEGIIHRDLKPENILVSNKDYVLADFGIASYNPEIFKLRAKTKDNERIGNRLFSAPEQENGGITANETMDIYSIGQILHWLISSETHRGTNRKNISNKIKELGKYDHIIDRCLSNDPQQRYKSIEEIREHLKNLLFSKEKDIWEYLYDFGDVLVKSFPKNEFGIVHSNNIKRIDRLFSTLKKNEEKFEQQLWWHNGSSNIHFQLTKKAEGIWKLNNKEISIKEIWLHYDLSFFNDFIIVHYAKGNPFNVNGKEQYYNVFVDNKYEISYSEYENKFAEINDEIVDLKNHKVEFIEREKKEGYLIIATRFHCALRMNNDKAIRDFFDKLEASNGKWEIEQFQEFERIIRVHKMRAIQDSL